MKRYKWAIGLSVCMAGIMVGIVASASVGAEPLRIYELESPGATYLEMDLEREIYRYSPDPLLRDLMVLDAEGKELPSRIVTLHQALKESSTSYPLRFFPVQAGEDPSAWLSRRGAELRIDDDVVSLRLDPERRAQGPAAEFYIIDISNLDQALDVLEVDWLADEANRVVAVEVSGSNDLQRWTALTRATLAQLDKEGETLLRNSVKLSLQPKRYDYLRLRFLNNTAVQVQSLAGHRVVRHIEGPASQRWQIAGVLADDQRPVRTDRRYGAEATRSDITAWEFQRDERAPINRVSLDLGAAGYGDRVRLYSREHPRQPWQLLHSGIWFNVKVGDEWQQSEAIILQANSHPYWRLELSKGQALIDPALVFEYPQQRLQFIANNTPPYSVAINAEIPAQRAASQVFMRVLDGREVDWQSVSKKMVEGVQPVDVRVGFNWQALLFWAALSLAVVVLAVFALRLLRQMDNQD